MRSLPLVAALFIVLSGTATAGHPGSRISDQVDPQSKLRTVRFEARTRPCAAPTTSDGNDAAVRLDFVVSQTSGAPEYVVVVTLAGGEWVHPGRRGSLGTLTDKGTDELFPLDRISKWSDHPWYGGRVRREAIPFAANRAWFEDAANTRVLQFRVNGQDRTLERCTDARELADLRDLLARAATL